MKKLNLRFCFFTFITAVALFGCEQKCEDKLLDDHPIFLDLVDSLAFGNIQISECASYYPIGISDTLIFGYKHDQLGVFHNDQLNLESLKIIGLKCENIPRHSFDFYYYFKFTDTAEKKHFLDFKKSSAKYLAHQKDQPRYFNFKNEIFLRITPMP